MRGGAAVANPPALVDVEEVPRLRLATRRCGRDRSRAGRRPRRPPSSSSAESAAATLPHAIQAHLGLRCPAQYVDRLIHETAEGKATRSQTTPFADVRLGGRSRPARAPPCTLGAMEAASGTLRIGDEASAVVGGTPLVALRRLGAGLAGEVCAKLEYFNPGGLGQGPDRRRDDRRGRARRPHRARRSGDRRADQRQHRDRAGDGLRGARLRADPDAARGDEPRARQAAARLRGRGARDAVARRHDRGGRAGERDLRAAQGLHAAAVRQPGQPGDPSPDHGRGDLERHRRRGRRLRRRRRHRRHDHRRRPGAEGALAGHADRRGRARDLAGPLRRQARARTRSRASAPASCPRSSTAR